MDNSSPSIPPPHVSSFIYSPILSLLVHFVLHFLQLSYLPPLRPLLHLLHPLRSHLLISSFFSWGINALGTVIVQAELEDGTVGIGTR
jgi:fumarate reductase subunit D